MEWLNYLSRKDKIAFEEYKHFLIALAPFAPHMSEELWQMIGKKYSIHSQTWLKIDKKYLEDESVLVMIQVNGKIRSQIMIEKDIINKGYDIEKRVLKDPRVKKHMAGKTVKRYVYVPGRIFNLLTD